MGSSTYRMVCQVVAPSTLEAMMYSLGMDSIAEEKIIIPKEAPINPLTRTENVTIYDAHRCGPSHSLPHHNIHNHWGNTWKEPQGPKGKANLSVDMGGYQSKDQGHPDIKKG